MRVVFSRTVHGLMASFFMLTIFIPSTARSALDDIVFVKGVATESQLTMAQGQSEPGEISYQEACVTTNQLLFAAVMSTPPSVMNFIYGGEPGMGAIRPLDCSQAQPTRDRYVMVFSSCSMTMTDGVHTMHWTVPPGAPEAQMVIVDAQSRQFIEGSALETDLGNVANFVKGREIRQEVRPASGSREYEIELEIGPTGNYRTSTETFTGQAYTYEYEGEIGMPGMREMGLPMSKMESTGTAWIAPDVPGTDVVAEFYENFKTHVTPATESGTLFTAMIEQMADVVQNGMPLETKQTTKSSMPLGGFGAMAENRMTQGNTSTSKISAVTVWQGAAAEHDVCGHREAPEGYTVTSMSEMMSGANEGSSEDMAEAMQQYNEAMQNMTPEDRRMMEQMGMGNMMEQIMGGANPGAQPQMSSTPPPQSSSAGSNMPSSDELQGGSMTETVQKHLQALGYDVGEANGDMSLNTSIAISTFQAEKKMEVTGEVSPQLLGALSAEVDGRR